MSSPVHNDLDKRSMYAPPWARETQQQPPQAILAAIERLRQERLQAAAPSPHDAVVDDAALRRDPHDDRQQELPLQEQPRQDLARQDLPRQQPPLRARPDPIDIEAEMAEAVRAAWTPPPLDPVTMPEPPKPRLGGPTWGMAVRLSGAVGFAAIIALFAAGVVPLPSIDISLNSGESAKAASPVVQAFGSLDARGPRQALPVAVADASPSATLPVSAVVSPPSASLPPPKAQPSSAVPPEVLSAFASLDTAAAVPAPAPFGSKIESPQALAPAPVSRLPDVRGLERDELAGLVKRGQALLAEGDISSARLLLRRAAEAGDAAAALTLAGTYDRAELAKLKVIGVAHDHAQAKAWYAKAIEHGSAEAVRRMQQLAQRTD